MNNPIIVTDRVLSYYDSKLKGYIGSLYGCDMTVEWEPMENGKNYFKLKIALKNKHGAELFSKIVDFPLEQTIVSGSYNNETKSLILYFQDGTSTSIPVSELIDGLATKTELDKKADKGNLIKNSDTSNIKSVPTGANLYARITRIGGYTKRCTNIYPVSIGYIWGLDCTLEADGTVSMIRTGNGGVAFFNSHVFTLEAGMTYSFRYSGNSIEFVQLVKQNGESVSATFYDHQVYTPSQTESYFLRIYMSNSKVSVGDTASVKLWINNGDTPLPYEPYFAGLRSAKVTEIKSVKGDTSYILTLPEAVTGIDGYGQSNPDDPNEYNCLDLENGKLIIRGKIKNGVWVAENTVHSVDTPSIIPVIEGGSIIFKNEFEQSIPNTVEFYTNEDQLLCSKKLVGDLIGTADVAKYYDDNGNPSTQTIGEALNKLFTAGNPIKITAEPIGQLSTTQMLTDISANILANPPVAINDIIIDRYLDGDAAYLCFWLVTNVSGGSTDSTMTLQGTGNIYVGGGSASVADKAISDGNGNNIVSTYETKAQVKAITDEIKSTANSAYERATAAINIAQDSLNRVNRGVKSISADYTSGAGSIGTFYLRVNFVGGGSESYDITEELRGLVNDVLTYDR